MSTFNLRPEYHIGGPSSSLFTGTYHIVLRAPLALLFTEGGSKSVAVDARVTRSRAGYMRGPTNDPLLIYLMEHWKQ